MAYKRQVTICKSSQQRKNKEVAAKGNWGSDRQVSILCFWLEQNGICCKTTPTNSKDDEIHPLKGAAGYLVCKCLLPSKQSRTNPLQPRSGSPAWSAQKISCLGSIAAVLSAFFKVMALKGNSTSGKAWGMGRCSILYRQPLLNHKMISQGLWNVWLQHREAHKYSGTKLALAKHLHKCRTKHREQVKHTIPISAENNQKTLMCLTLVLNNNNNKIRTPNKQWCVRITPQVMKFIVQIRSGVFLVVLLLLTATECFM